MRRILIIQSIYLIVIIGSFGLLGFLFVCFCFLSKVPHPVLFSVLFISSLGVSFALPTVGAEIVDFNIPTAERVVCQ